jgi:hypothetical protein
MSRRHGWMKTAMRLVTMLDVERCIDELFDGGLLTLGLPEKL